MHVAGVDGCRGGWLCLEEKGDTLRTFVAGSFDQLLDYLGDAAVITIDVPIGLPDSGERPCDPVARQLLRAPRASSVFPVPIRTVALERDYQTACAAHRQVDGRALSRQAFAILPKISEVDFRLSAKPELQQRVREIHPEVCFAVWNNGVPMKHRKTLPLSRVERERLIDGMWPDRPRLLAECRGSAYEADDLNDAFAALWTAKRIVAGTASVLGPQGSDSHGLRMEMWA